jgi:hypothetical protein
MFFHPMTIEVFGHVVFQHVKQLIVMTIKSVELLNSTPCEDLKVEVSG